MVSSLGLAFLIQSWLKMVESLPDNDTNHIFIETPDLGLLKRQTLSLTGKIGTRSME